MEVTTVKQNPGIRFRVAGILMREGKILIQRGITDEEYALPGGHVEMFERSEETLIREFKEEMNVEITVRKFCGFRNVWENGIMENIIIYVFIIKLILLMNQKFLYTEYFTLLTEMIRKLNSAGSGLIKSKR
ncbi:MAG: NUDIX domain-containing protein [Ignavibacteria bacterium]|nr:NUDIX domain-containing protein [Ignavibacteria bacterium]